MITPGRRRGAPIGVEPERELQIRAAAAVTQVDPGELGDPVQAVVERRAVKVQPLGGGDDVAEVANGARRRQQVVAGEGRQHLGGRVELDDGQVYRRVDDQAPCAQCVPRHRVELRPRAYGRQRGLRSPNGLGELSEGQGRSAGRGRSPAMCARSPPGNGQPPRRPPLSTCTRASTRSRSTVISSDAAAESGPRNRTRMSRLRRRSTSRREISAWASTSAARAAHSTTAGN